MNLHEMVALSEADFNYAKYDNDIARRIQSLNELLCNLLDLHAYNKAIKTPTSPNFL
jgi:hypothetical protein